MTCFTVFAGVFGLSKMMGVWSQLLPICLNIGSCLATPDLEMLHIAIQGYAHIILAICERTRPHLQ